MKNLGKRRQLVGAGAGTSADTGTAGHAGVQSCSLDHSEVVARSQFSFQKEWRAAAAQPPLRDDGDTIT